MSEIDEEEALRPIAKIKNDIIKSTSIIGLIALSLFGIGAFLLIRSITKPLSQLKKTMGFPAARPHGHAGCPGVSNGRIITRLS